MGRRYSMRGPPSEFGSATEAHKSSRKVDIVGSFELNSRSDVATQHVISGCHDVARVRFLIKSINGFSKTISPAFSLA